MVEYDGQLYVSGQGFFSTGDGIGIVKWNGSEFEALPGMDMFGSHRIEAMAVHDGLLYVGGAFQSANGTFGSISDYVASWDGSTWSTVGAGFDNVVYSLHEYQGDLYAGGDFYQSGDSIVRMVGRWDGAQWRSTSTGMTNNGRVAAMKEFQGVLYAAGNFHNNTLDTYCIARWDGTSWSTLGGAGIEIGLYALEIYDEQLVVVGVDYHEASGMPVNGLASWDGAAWSTFDAYDDAQEQLGLAAAIYHGDLYVGGDFPTIGGLPIKGITRYDGAQWQPVGSGLDSTGINTDTLIWSPGDTLFIQAPHRVNAMMEYQGDLYVGGRFNMIGGVEAHDIAKWNLPVGLGADPLGIAVRLYPNPATNALNLEVPPGSVLSMLRIFDSTGRIVVQEDHPRHGPIDTGHLPDGMYLVQVNIGDGWVRNSFSVFH